MISLQEAPFLHREYPRGMLSVWFGRDLRPPKRAQRAIIAGILASILIHVGVMLLRLPTPKLDASGDNANTGPIAVTINLKKPGAAAPAPAQPAQPKELPQRPVYKSAPVMASNRSRPQSSFTVPPQPDPTPVPVAPVTPENDFLANKERRQQMREAQENSERVGNAAATAAESGGDRDAKIRENIKRSMNSGKEGGGGVFMLGDIGIREATFTFRGWTPADRRTTYPQTYRVDAGLNGDVHRAIIRRMIELIRNKYDGDFDWESHRLGRVVKMSARPQDQAQLEEFLLKEMFADDGIHVRTY